ncbi:Retrovirus-related Pol polyprotein from transposon 17.6 [Dictyocoela muelleri]|nr:Retrovirus-related Pol polyprotein from transposon 17.6 [Dictyocoela muelleri]
MNKIFTEIKQQNILHYPDLNKPYELKCDASDLGIGAILTQESKVVGIFSKKFKGSENNYTIVEKEALGVIESLKHFKQIVFGSHIIIYTDNKNPIFKGDLTKRMNRWLILLEEYDYVIKHVNADENIKADILSRSFKIKGNELQISYNYLSTIKKIKEYFEKLKYEIHTEKNDKKINFLLYELHNLLVHPGRNKMINTLRR